MNINKSASYYFLVQGAGVLLWWCLLFFAPSTRVFFEMGGSENILLGFWLPDILFLAIGSVIAGFLCVQNVRFTSIVVWFVTGAISYAAAYCLSFALLTDTGWLGVVFMIPAMLWSGAFAVGLPPVSDYMFRETRPAKTNWILAKTFGQIVIVWTLILAIFPVLITRVEAKLGIPNFSFPFQGLISLILFAAISSLGVASAVTMSRIGKGTPLPLDHAPNLVNQGVYAYVRNPMALSGIGQGIAVALFLGSPLVFVYALMGSLIWQLIFRPLEEENLRNRFGVEYLNYCAEVRCWIPNSRPYVPKRRISSPPV